LGHKRKREGAVFIGEKKEKKKGRKIKKFAGTRSGPAPQGRGGRREKFPDS